MTDYGKLADHLKNLRTPAQQQTTHPVVFFESVNAHLTREIEKANVELRKRRLGIIERVFLPSFHGKHCLTFDSELLCTVEVQEDPGKIIAVIFGPPNRIEIARKEYFVGRAPDAHAAPRAGTRTSAGYSPEQVAVEIVSALLTREFA